MNFLALSLLLTFINEMENQAIILRYQYEQKIKELRTENARLQQKVHDLKKSLEQLKKQKAEASTKENSKEASTKEDVETKLTAPSSETDLDLYQIALKLIEEEKWNEAILALERVVKEFPSSQYADNSIFMMAKVYGIKAEWELARLELLRLLETYPESEQYHAAKMELQKIESFQISTDRR